MTSASPVRVLVVADRIATTPLLLDALRGRVARGPAAFTVVVPYPAPAELHPTHPERHDKLAAAERDLALALPLLEQATGAKVRGSVSTRSDPMDVIEDTLRGGSYDEIILSSAPHRVSTWLHLDLPHRVAHLGLPVTTIMVEHRQAADG